MIHWTGYFNACVTLMHVNFYIVNCSSTKKVIWVFGDVKIQLCVRHWIKSNEKWVTFPSFNRAFKWITVEDEMNKWGRRKGQIRGGETFVGLLPPFVFILLGRNGKEGRATSRKDWPWTVEKMGLEGTCLGERASLEIKAVSKTACLKTLKLMIISHWGEKKIHSN